MHPTLRRSARLNSTPQPTNPPKPTKRNRTCVDGNPPKQARTTPPDSPTPPADPVPEPPADPIPESPTPPVDPIPESPTPAADPIPESPTPPADPIPESPTPPADPIPESPTPPADPAPTLAAPALAPPPGPVAAPAPPFIPVAVEIGEMHPDSVDPTNVGDILQGMRQVLRRSGVDPVASCVWRQRVRRKDEDSIKALWELFVEVLEAGELDSLKRWTYDSVKRHAL